MGCRGGVVDADRDLGLVSNQAHLAYVVSLLVRAWFLHLWQCLAGPTPQDMAEAEATIALAAACARFDMALAPGQVILNRY